MQVKYRIIQQVEQSHTGGGWGGEDAKILEGTLKRRDQNGIWKKERKETLLAFSINSMRKGKSVQYPPLKKLKDKGGPRKKNPLSSSLVSLGLKKKKGKTDQESRKTGPISSKSKVP